MNDQATGSFAPLRRPTFTVLWIATVLGNTGSFMRDVASAWLMTDLSASPTSVALVQAAASIPIFLLAIPAGVLSDIVDRRKLLIAIQVLLAGVSGSLMYLSYTGAMTVSLLIALTFAGGIGAALMGPTWQSIVPELVPKPELRSAVALNSLGVNISRSIGPAVGGLLLAGFGAAITYGADVVSYAFVIAALLWWRRPAAGSNELSERFGGAFVAGLRYARASKPLHRVLQRSIVYFAFASSVWALLPIVARTSLQADAAFYGILLGAVGIGAILGALLLPRMRAWLDVDGLLFAAAIGTAIAMAALSFAPSRWLALLLLLLLGVAWIVALTTLNATAQGILPNWVRGRGLAVYLTVFNGAMAAGSLLWGMVAQRIGVDTALLVSAIGLTVAAIALLRVKLPTTESDLMPSNHWPEPMVAAPVPHDRGPVLILVHYRVGFGDRAEFLAALSRLAEERRRDGAYAWGVTEDAADPLHILEWFMTESWAEHLRQHQRVSRDDADVQSEVARFQIEGKAPAVEHYLSLPTRPVAVI